MTTNGLHNITIFFEVEDKDRQAVCMTLGNRSRVHDFKVFRDDRFIVQLAKEDSVRVFLGVIAVNAVDSRRLENDIGVQLQTSIGSGGVGRHERRPRSGGKDDDPPLFQMTDSSTAE